MAARPIDLAIIDGISSQAAGETAQTTRVPIRPGVLLDGKIAVCTDAIGATVMGIDLMATRGTAPRTTLPVQPSSWMRPPHSRKSTASSFGGFTSFEQGDFDEAYPPAWPME